MGVSPGRDAVLFYLSKPYHLTWFPHTGVSPGHFRHTYDGSRTIFCLLFYHTGLLNGAIETKDVNVLKYLKFGID